MPLEAFESLVFSSVPEFRNLPTSLPSISRSCLGRWLPRKNPVRTVSGGTGIDLNYLGVDEMNPERKKAATSWTFG